MSNLAVRGTFRRRDRGRQGLLKTPESATLEWHVALFSLHQHRRSRRQGYLCFNGTLKLEEIGEVVTRAGDLRRSCCCSNRWKRE